MRLVIILLALATISGWIVALFSILLSHHSTPVLRGELSMRLRIAELELMVKTLQKQSLTCNCSNDKSTKHDFNGMIHVEYMNTSSFCDWKVFTKDRWLKYLRSKHVKWRHERMGGKAHGKHNRTWFPNEWWCDKMGSSVQPYTPLKKSGLSVDDIAMGVYTGNTLYFGRALTSKITWLSRFPNHALFGPSDEPNVGVIGLSKYKVRVDTDSKAHVGMVNMYGLKELYLRFPKAKWYVTVGDDSYFVVDKLVRMMDVYDHSECVVYCHSVVQHNVDSVGRGRHVNLTGFPATKKQPRFSSFSWCAGSVPFFMTSCAVKRYMENIDRFYEQNPFIRDDARPDLNIGLVMSLSEVSYKKLKPEHIHGAFSYACDGEISGRSCHGNYYSHYLTPWRMILLDQWEQRQTLDQMMNGLSVGRVQWSEFVKYLQGRFDDFYDKIRLYTFIVRHIIRSASNRSVQRDPHRRVSWNINFDDLPTSIEHYRKMQKHLRASWSAAQSKGIYDLGLDG